MIKKKIDLSDQITIEEINKVYENNFESIIYEFVNFEVEWLHNAYSQYKDIDKYIILIKLIHKTLSTYKENFYKMNFEQFYNSPHIEIEKISIIDLVKELNISKETVRRKLNELSKAKVVIRNLKKIKITHVSSNPKLERNVYNLSKLIYIFIKNLQSDDKLSRITRKELEKIILKNYTQYWNLFFSFQIPYILRWKKIFKSSENFYIFALCSFNEVINFKKLKIDKDNIFSNVDQLHEEITDVQKKTKGLNPTTISEISGIPRATIIRKINYLTKNYFLRKSKKSNLYYLNNEKSSKSFVLQGKMFKENQKALRSFMREIINLIKN